MGDIMRAIVAMFKPGAPVAPAVAKPEWREEGGVIYFTLPPTDGTTGEQWIARLEAGGWRVWDGAKIFLRLSSFVPTSGVTYEVAVLKGESFFEIACISENICAVAKKRKFVNLHPEAACLIREMFSDEELQQMGLWGIVAMSGGQHLLCAYRYGSGRGLGVYTDSPDDRWSHDNGFAFALAQLASFPRTSRNERCGVSELITLALIIIQMSKKLWISSCMPDALYSL